MREWLSLKRRDKGSTQLDVAAHTGISRAYYTQIELSLRNPSIKVAKNIAGYLGFEWTRFFETTDGLIDYSIPVHNRSGMHYPYNRQEISTKAAEGGEET
jgi:putative transcriptional regulator